jgi:hypothetical protein
MFTYFLKHFIDPLVLLGTDFLGYQGTTHLDHFLYFFSTNHRFHSLYYISFITHYGDSNIRGCLLLKHGKPHISHIQE